MLLCQRGVIGWGAQSAANLRMAERSVDCSEEEGEGCGGGSDTHGEGTFFGLSHVDEGNLIPCGGYCILSDGLEAEPLGSSGSAHAVMDRVVSLGIRLRTLLSRREDCEGVPGVGALLFVNDDLK